MDKLFQLTGLHIYEYLLLIRIPADLRKRIEEQQSDIINTYKLTQPEPGRPNIPLARFRAIKNNEERIIQKLEKVTENLIPFNVDLKDYRGYPMHALLIEVVNQQKILDLVKSIKQARKMMHDGKEAPYFINDPNIVLVGRLENDTYIEIWKEYCQQKFRDRFTVESFLLLRRSAGEAKYELITEFSLKKTEINKKQTVLFS